MQEVSTGYKEPAHFQRCGFRLGIFMITKNYLGHGWYKQYTETQAVINTFANRSLTKHLQRI